MPSQLDSLINSLKNGPPRTAYHAGQELKALGRAAEAPLISLLQELKTAHQLHDILGLLEAIRITQPVSVARVVRYLDHEQSRVRAAAASCLLHSSPKLRPYLGQIQSALKHEKNPQVQALLHKLLNRYPHQG